MLAVAATLAAVGCGRKRQLVHTSLVSELADSADQVVGGAQERVRDFRTQQFDYVDQLRAAIEDATQRGEFGEAALLSADLADTLVATGDDWRTLKRQLDRDLDGAMLLRGAPTFDRGQRH